jgi:trimethylamine--corrinoid protein Co-methyltransferase
LKGFQRIFKPLEILTSEQIEKIYSGALDVLADTGIRFDHPRALELFAAAGAVVDFSQKMVKIPATLVEQTLSSCPRSFRMKARALDNELSFGGDTVFFGTFPGMESVDLETGERSKVCKEEYYQTVTLLDALENLHFLSAYCPYFGFEGVPPVMAIPESVAARLRNSGKCLLTGTTDDSEIFTLQMAAAVGVDIMGGCSCASPLTYYHGAVESTFRVVETGNPIQVISGPVMGGTSPATIAGSLVQHCAELLAGICLVQLIRSGTRVMVTNLTLQQDMRSGLPFFGAVGNGLFQAAFGQLWRRLGVPVKTSVPGVSNAKTVGYQIGIEKALGALIAALSGAHLVYLHGGVYGELTFHPLQAILDDDLAGMIGRFLEGMRVEEDTLAVDLIARVGPIPGFFLDTDHTLQWWKAEQYLPKTLDHSSYPQWLAGERKDCLDRAERRFREILSSHRPLPLPQEQDREISRILEEAAAYYQAAGKLD